MARGVASLPLVRDGVPILAGMGLGAFVAPGGIAGDCATSELASRCSSRDIEAFDDVQQLGRECDHSSRRLWSCCQRLVVRDLLRRLELWIAVARQLDRCVLRCSYLAPWDLA